MMSMCSWETWTRSTLLLCCSMRFSKTIPNSSHSTWPSSSGPSTTLLKKYLSPRWKKRSTWNCSRFSADSKQSWSDRTNKKSSHKWQQTQQGQTCCTCSNLKAVKSCLDTLRALRIWSKIWNCNRCTNHRKLKEISAQQSANKRTTCPRGSKKEHRRWASQFLTWFSY